jgi:hypothetical protein
MTVYTSETIPRPCKSLWEIDLLQNVKIGPRKRQLHLERIWLDTRLPSCALSGIEEALAIAAGCATST